MLCIVACKDITEVACWNNNIYLVAKLYLTVSNKLSVCRYIVDYLWCKSAPVDRVCRGEHHAVLSKLVGSFLACEDSLNTCLSVVKVALDSANADVAALLSCHLLFLHS